MNLAISQRCFENFLGNFPEVYEIFWSDLFCHLTASINGKQANNNTRESRCFPVIQWPGLARGGNTRVPILDNTDLV